MFTDKLPQQQSLIGLLLNSGGCLRSSDQAILLNEEEQKCCIKIDYLQQPCWLACGSSPVGLVVEMCWSLSKTLCAGETIPSGERAWKSRPCRGAGVAEGCLPGQTSLGCLGAKRMVSRASPRVRSRRCEPPAACRRWWG